MEEGLDVRIEEGVATLTINRERRRNALDDATLHRLREALGRASAPDVGCIVLAGAGTKAFSAGSDLKALADLGYEQRLAHTALGQEIADLIERHPRPVIAAIEGYCLGGGLEMALACDLRIAGGGAVLGLPEVTINALPSWGGTARLPRIVGLGRAREMILLGRTLDAATALAWGLVTEAVPEGQARARALEFAREIAAKRDRNVLALAKRLVTLGWDSPTGTATYLAYLADMSQLRSEALAAGVSGFVKGRRET
jgi:enoyl-CoA hydratase